jgi:hypothetical protein
MPRRAAAASTTISAAVALPVIASRSDPIFALIEAHRASWAEMHAASDACGEIEDERFGGRLTPGYEEWMARLEAQPDYRAAVEQSAAATIAEEAAFLGSCGQPQPPLLTAAQRSPAMSAT